MGAREFYPEFGRKGAGSGDQDDGEKDISQQLARISGEIKTFAEKANSEMKATGDLSKETKARVDELLAKQSGLEARMLEIEQKQSLPPGGGDDPEVKSMGHQVIESDALKAYVEAGKGRSGVRIPVKAVTSSPTSAGAAVAPHRLPGILPLPTLRLTIRDLLAPGTTGSNAVEYVRESGFTNNAAPVSEAPARKPESDLTFEAVTTGVKTIAHFIKATKQILDDFAQLQSYIDGRLEYGLALKEETQLLKGSGVGNNLHGILPQASAYVPAFSVPFQTSIDQLRLAMLQAELAEFPASGIVLNPIDWARIELMKDGDQRYLFALPQGVATKGLWGRPVVDTQAMDVADFLVGAFRLGAQIFDRQQSTVEIAYQNEDDFVRNMVTIRNEERLAFALYRPEAFVHGTFEVESA